MALPWNTLLADQLDWHWRHQLRERLAGLTDDEYFWQPVPDCWTVHPDSETGRLTIDWAFPPPEPALVTTIAWRLNHILIGVLGMRSAWHFGGPSVDYATYAYPATAADALDRLDVEVERWLAGVRGLDEEALARPCGEEGPYAQAPMAGLVLHINREMLHHGAEIALLRDLYQHTFS